MNEPEAGAVDPQGRRVLIIFNPVAGARRKGLLDAVVDKLGAADCRVTLRETQYRGAAEEIARNAGTGQWDVVTAAGGDGTINEVINGLYGTDVPLAIVPMGTANVLAAEIGVTADAEILARTLASGTGRPIHLGVVNGRLFAMMAGAGFDAKVVAGVSGRLKRIFGKGAFVLETLRGIVSYSRSRYVVTVDDRTFEASSVVVANGHFYGGRFTCAPLARLEDPVLYACVFLKTGPLRALRYCTWLVLDMLHRLPDVAVLPAVRVSVDGTAGEPVQGDGDIITATPVTISLAEKPLRIVMPV